MKPNLFLEEKQRCIYCKNESFFFVDKDDCKTCENNGIKDDDGYSYRRPEPDEERTEVEDDGECLLGYANGQGCSIVVCSRCGELHGHTPIGYD